MSLGVPGSSPAVTSERMAIRQELAEHLCRMPKEPFTEIFEAIIAHPEEAKGSPESFMKRYPLRCMTHSPAVLVRYTAIFQSTLLHAEDRKEVAKLLAARKEIDKALLTAHAIADPALAEEAFEESMRLFLEEAVRHGNEEQISSLFKDLARHPLLKDLSHPHGIAFNRAFVRIGLEIGLFSVVHTLFWQEKASPPVRELLIRELMRYDTTDKVAQLCQKAVQIKSPPGTAIQHIKTMSVAFAELNKSGPEIIDLINCIEQVFRIPFSAPTRSFNLNDILALLLERKKFLIVSQLLPYYHDDYRRYIAFRSFATALVENKEVEKAKAEAGRLYKDDPAGYEDRDRRQAALAEILAYKGMFSEAIECAQSVIFTDNAREGAYADIARAFIHHGLLDNVLDIVNQHVNNSIDKNSIFFLLATALVKKGFVAEALSTLSLIEDIGMHNRYIAAIAKDLATSGHIEEAGQMIVMMRSDRNDRLSAIITCCEQLTDLNQMFMLCTLLPGPESRWVGFLQRGQIKEMVDNLLETRDPSIDALNMQLAVIIIISMEDSEYHRTLEKIQELPEASNLLERIRVVRASLSELEGRLALFLQRGQIREMIDNLLEIRDPSIGALSMSLAVKMITSMKDSEYHRTLEKIEERGAFKLLERIKVARASRDIVV